MNETTDDTDRSATREEIMEWDEENDGPHPVFDVPHRPERTGVTERLARFVCDDCGRDWKQYKREEKDVPCLRCRGENVEERSLQPGELDGVDE